MPRSFEEVVLPHLDAAFNYARWLAKNDADAEDVVQDAYMRALRFFSSLRGEDARAWLLTIVRNTWARRFPRRAGGTVMTVADEEEDRRPDASLDPEAQLIQQQTVEQVRRALETLPADFREVLVLREASRSCHIKRSPPLSGFLWGRSCRGWRGHANGWRAYWPPAN